VTKQRSMWECSAISFTIVVLGLTLAYVAGCAIEGEWMTPSPGMMLPLGRDPWFVPFVAGVLACGGIMWGALRRAK
jgi:hypothetical protein